MVRRSQLCAGLLLIILAATSRPAVAELAFAGAGASQCDLINSNAAPGRGNDQNQVTRYMFSWVQGYMSGFNGYSFMIDKGSPFDLGAASPDAQWEYIVSYCRSHPHDYIVKAIQDLQLKLLKK